MTSNSSETSVWRIRAIEVTLGELPLQEARSLSACLAIGMLNREGSVTKEVTNNRNISPM